MKVMLDHIFEVATTMKERYGIAESKRFVDFWNKNK